MEARREVGAGSDLVKWIALVTMFLDHMGVLIFPGAYWLRTIGRIAFPIFAYGIARGVSLSHDRPAYLKRLAFFGLISQIPFMWLNYGAQFKPKEINQIPQLLYAALLILLLEWSLKQDLFRKIPGILVVLFLSVLPDLLISYFPEWGFAYSTYGIWMSLLFWLFRGRWGLILPAYLLLSLVEPWLSVSRFMVSRQSISYWESFMNIQGNLALIQRNSQLSTLNGLFFQARSVMALPILWLGEKVTKPYRMNRWLAYWFYPVHIAVLVILHFVLFRTLP